MQHKHISLADTKAFSSFFLDYIEQKETLKPFFHRFPTLSNFGDQIAEKGQSFSPHHRQVLVATLRRQYETVHITEATEQNISALSDPKTFTVTTGHQLNIFTGPLYFIYKIVTVINACKRLKEAYPQFNFVPVYWMASEDHDYDEIKSFRLYGKKYTWETGQTGAVGRFHTKDFRKLLEAVPGDVSLFKEAYTKNKTLAAAARHYVNALFGDEGLVVLDADERELKALFTPVINEDVFEHTTLKLVDATDKKLADLGYKTQVFCRDINFFYLDKDVRARLTTRDGVYHVLDTLLTFTADEMRTIISSQPEKLSPNVILRPLYQEWILPNLAYVGGPSENVYWLQLKNVFDHFRVPFPMLMPRNFALVLDHTIERKRGKTGLDLVQFFEEKNYLFNEWILHHAHKNLTVGAERDTVLEIYNHLKTRATSIDKTLGPFVAAEGARVLNSLEKIERKMLRAEKRNHSDKLRQIEEVKDALFPNGSLQERVDNFLNFYQHDNRFVQTLLRLFDPFDYRFNVLTYSGHDEKGAPKNLS